MALKESIDILIRDMKNQDARIEADLQTYATLLSNVEVHTEKLKQRKEEKEIFERLLYRIGGERDFSKDSVHIQTMDHRIMTEEREIANNNGLIGAQQAYYSALKEKDYKTLWEQDGAKSAMAATCFAFEQWDGTSSELVQQLLGARNEKSEEAVRYFLEKALVYSESQQEKDTVSEEVDVFLAGLLNRTFHPQFDMVWQNIETCLRIRKTQRTMVNCKTILANYQEYKSLFETFEVDYANTCNGILAEIQQLENQRIGKEVAETVKTTREWFFNRTAELNNLIMRRRNEGTRIENQIWTLRNIHTELENGMEWGLTLERCDAICNTLKSIRREAAGFVDAKKLDKERKQLLPDFEKHLKSIQKAKDSEVEKAKEEQRRRVRAKAEWKRRFRRALPFLAAGVALFLFYLRCGTNVYYGTGDIYFGNGRFKNYRVAGGVEEIPSDLFQNNKSMETIVLPDGLVSIGSYAFAGCTSLKEVVIPESVTSISTSAFAGCTALESVEIHSSTLSLGGDVFTNCGSLAKIKNKGKIADFEMVLQNNVRNCSNLDESEIYDNLYYESMKGVPLLENKTQLINMLDQRVIPYGQAVTEKFNPEYDTLTNVEFDEEETDENGRSVDFSFDMEKNGITYEFRGTVSSGLEQSGLNVELRCTNIDLGERMQQIRTSDKTALLELLDGMAVQVGGTSVTIDKEEISILESKLVEESAEKYWIPVSMKISKPFGEIYFLGSVLLAEQNAYLPKLITSEVSTVGNLNLLGSYATSPNGEAVFTIDKRYEKCYSVTNGGEKQILVMDVTTEHQGVLISTADGSSYNLSTVAISEGMDGIKVNGTKYYKVGFAISDTMPESVSPVVGVWQGTYQLGDGATVNSRRYILPAGQSVLAVISDFGPMEGANNMEAGTTLDTLYYDSQSGACSIESRNWLEQPDGYGFAYFEGSVNDSKTIMSGNGEYPFFISKTELRNTSVVQAEAVNWSIYDTTGAVKEKLITRNENIPEDAFRWNGSSYYLYNNCATWEEAKAFCESLGGHLAVIASADENAALYSYVTEQGYWNAFFGASDAIEEGNWRWLDSYAMSYTNWHPGEPNSESSGEDYAMFYQKFPDGTWNDSRFDSGSVFICEWD